jgi:hypothetical protein
MEEKLRKLIEKYEKRISVCLEMLEASKLDSEKKYYQSLALLWKTVIKELEEILR